MERCRHGHAEHGEVRAGSPVSGLSEGEDNGTVHEQHQTSSRPLCPQTTPAALHSGNRAGDVFELRQFSVDLHPPAASATIESAPSVKSEKRTALQGWWLEGLSLLIAIALLSAISTILAVYNGKRQPSWRYSINLSTIIAVMSTLLRMCLSTAVEAAISQLKWYWHCDPRPLQHLSLFDAASRGPLGSLFLFFRLRSLSVAHLGGLITILSLAIGPFSQQALHSVNCQKPLSHLHPTIRIANSIPDTVDLETDYNLDSVGASAILDAIANSPLNTSSGYTSSAKGTAQVLDGCATGNCTFGNGNGVAYSTIGVCTQCIDATNLIEWVPAWAVSDAGNVTTKIPKLPNGLHIPVISGPNLSAPSIVVQFDDSLEWLPWLPTAPARLKAVSKGPSIIKWTMLTSTSVGCAGRSGGEWDCGYDLGPEDHTPILDFSRKRQSR
ncbi:hypothetical protein EJ06DRAFT_244985 [Trichodelitschia bisporula]|uniref:Uncharacterized protein n=1 Tax=Trichodelitschia bisporula TaxID=703511 RepID=A0A6G1HJ99_9PEZI|nr:hypothetical protein EJ06DRAFT_244985 [Trichodelitschia bisporula]